MSLCAQRARSGHSTNSITSLQRRADAKTKQLIARGIGLAICCFAGF
jgi:hypothetical protein